MENLEKAVKIVAQFCEDVNSYNEDVYQNGGRDVWAVERSFLYLTHVEYPAWKGYKLHAAIVAALSVVKVVAHDDGYIGVYPSDEELLKKGSSVRIQQTGKGETRLYCLIG